MQVLTGFGEIAPLYDAFIVDIWGVLHDGVQPYPGATDCLARIKASGKRAVLLSNAPRRAWAAQAGMRAMGLADDLYDGIVTSGEATHMMLRDRPEPWYQALGHKIFHLGPERDLSLFEGLDIELVPTPEAADSVVNTGPDDHRNPTDITEFEPTLAACRARGLKMLCANPDMVVVRGNLRILCAGALAQRYAQMGGDVRSLGKPDGEIYKPVLAMAGVAKNRILAVGDGLATDIAGARNAGVDSCWVLGGIHGADHDPGETLARTGLAPVARIPTFIW